jgi:type IV pilus assembly protein PilM
VSDKKEIIINCGISHVSVGVFSQQGDQILLEQVGLETLRYDYSNEDLWLDCFSKGLENLCAREKIKGNARFIFPGSLLLSKTIRVPHVDEERQRKIVAFELMQKMPVPLTDLIWDYQVIDDDGVEQEILAFAVKPKVAEDFCEKVMELGLSPVQITPAPVLDYNALRTSGIGMESEETMVVNIGARTTNLLFLNPTGFLIRPISMGGNSLTQNISANLGTQFEKAEEIKKNYFSGAVTFSAEDPSVQLLENCSKQFLARLTQEVTRSVVTYKRLKKGKSPTKIYLAGRGALLNQLPEYLSQSQKLDIDYFDPLQALALSDKVSQEMRSLLPFMLSEPVGLAAAIFTSSSTESAVLTKTINLLPASKLTNLNFKKKQPFILLSAFMLSLTPLPAVLSGYFEADRLNDDLEQRNSVKNQLSEKLDGLESKGNTLTFLQYFNDQVYDRNEKYIEFGDSCWRTQNLVNLLQHSLNHVEVADTWFDEFKLITPTSLINRGAPVKKIVSDSVLILSGRYLVRPTVNPKTASEAILEDNLIQLNSAKQKALTNYLSNLPIIKQVRKKKFQTKERGDLFNRYYVYFEFEILLDK